MASIGVGFSTNQTFIYADKLFNGSFVELFLQACDHFLLASTQVNAKLYQSGPDFVRKFLP